MRWLVLPKAPVEAWGDRIAPCPLDLAAFKCTVTPRGSFVRRVCYSEPKKFMAIQLNAEWYPYRAVPARGG